MKSKDNYINNIKSSKSMFNNDLLTQINLILSKKIGYKNFKQDSYYSYYLSMNLPENKKYSIIKDELESDNDKNKDDFLAKDIINSKNEINSEHNNNSSKNESIKEISIQEGTESSEDEKDYSQQDSEDDENNIKNDELKEEKEIINEFPFDLDINNSSDFLIKKNLSQINNKSEQIIHENKNLDNNTNINNENDEINYWNFNISPNKIFNADSKKNHNNISTKFDANNEEYNPIIKNKEITYLKDALGQNSFNINTEYINNEEYNEEFLDNNFNNEKKDLFQNQNNNINFNFDKKIHNKQSQKNFTENNFICQDNKKVNNCLMHEDLYNETNKNQINILNNNNLYMNNKIIFYNNNNINLTNFNQNKNINFDTHKATNNINNISLGKVINDLNKNNNLIIMYGKYGWICRHSNNIS